ncbi:helix-turn-helix domain-containing protein [Gramella sp. AN32]|uniref:Helix-turn-helix domain-containing protein n=1 Tax=Christiangramia antarctica TaxID=2058158 RepID=A0ABW5XB32_9FLAO|nr:helix-turn-helix domain-containing protein [Gramella sp. AN32]MCM4158264.1 AraC family transcriptional regulator [Gramella sp. AN32]
MNNIPNIAFQSTGNQNDFELLDLTKFFEKIPDISDHNPTRPHRIEFFALLMVTTGTGIHEIDLKTYDLKAGSVLKIAKGQVHAFQDSPKYEGFLIVFTESFVLNFFSKSSIKLISHFYNYHITTPIAQNNTGNATFINQLIEELKTENSFAQKNIIASLLDLYLLRLERKSKNNQIQINNSKRYNTFIQFKDLVESDYTTTRNVKDYAEKMLVSTKLLNQTVKQFTLNTAKSFIDNYVILEAKRAIVSTEKSFKEMAFDLGFDEVTNFTKFFKKHTGTTPKQFKTGL